MPMENLVKMVSIINLIVNVNLIQLKFTYLCLKPHPIYLDSSTFREIVDYRYSE